MSSQAGSTSSRYPEAPGSFTPEQKRGWNELIRSLEDRDALAFFGSANSRANTYQTQNVTLATRTLDPTSTTLAVVANVLANLINDLKVKGVLS